MGKLTDILGSLREFTSSRLKGRWLFRPTTSSSSEAWLPFLDLGDAGGPEEEPQWQIIQAFLADSRGYDSPPSGGLRDSQVRWLRRLFDERENLDAAWTQILHSESDEVHIEDVLGLLNSVEEHAWSAGDSAEGAWAAKACAAGLSQSGEHAGASQLLNRLSIRESSMGHSLLALDTSINAVEEARILGPGEDLAVCLNTLANRLRENGRRREALHASREAVKLLQGMEGDSARRRLAAALTNLATHEHDQGLYAEAAALTQEAVSILREYQETTDDKATLASALTNLGTRLADLGQASLAEAAALEAVTAWEELVRIDPSFTRNLASALNNLSNRFAARRKYDSALQVCLRAVELRQEIALVHPGLAGELASSLTNLGSIYGSLGRNEEALRSAVRAVGMYRELNAKLPSFAADLASATMSLAKVQEEAGLFDEALVNAEEAVAIRRQLVAEGQGNRSLLGSSIMQFAEHMSDVGRRREADDYFREAIEILSSCEGQGESILPTIAEARARAARNLADLGEYDRAQAEYEFAERSAQEHAELDRMSDVLSRVRDGMVALAKYRAAAVRRPPATSEMGQHKHG